MTASQDIREQKTQLRSAMLKRRQAMSTVRQDEAARAVSRFADTLIAVAPTPAIFSSYRALKSELPTLYLEQELISRGASIALPVTMQGAAPLIFRLWQRDDLLETRKWGILEPAENAPVVQPDVILLPLLAFDKAGMRLGYGGGFYDRTLHMLRRDRPIVAVGLAYVEQEVDAVPYDNYDQHLDYILSPDGLRAFMDYRAIKCDFSS